MICELKISNIAIIKEAVINFGNGLNVLTGETGAGKSIIIDAINAILGERTSRELIRTGSDFAEVSALFQFVNSATINLLREMSVDCDDNSVLLYRKMTLDGKNICKINGCSVTVTMLKKVGQSLINVHGQLDNHNLLNDELHFTYIDKFAENESLRNKYLEAYRSYLSAKKKLDGIVTDESEKARKIDLLTYQIKEIEDADIKIGEKDDLEKRRKVLQNLETLVESVNNTISYINGTDEFSGAASLLSSATESASKAADLDDSLIEISNVISDAAYNIADCATELNRFLYSLDMDAGEIDDIENRLGVILRIFKKYGKNEADVLEYLEKSKQELKDIELSDELRAQCETEVHDCMIKLKCAADELSDNRKKFANDFIKAVSNELYFLDMESISLEIVQNKKDFDETGADEIYFLISANKGEAPKPLSKIASGGELSRIMLAIKNVLASKDNIQTLIFDEVDTGVSGRAAQKIGIKLKEVSKDRQVLCVTHLAQIACFAHNHFLISKSESNNKTYTNVEQLDKNGRINELARIIGGIKTTQLSLDTAAEMIANAENY